MSKSSVKITKDFDLIYQLDSEIFPYDERIEEDGNIFWLLKYDCQICGFCSMKILDKKTGYLSRAGILEEYRGLGLHKKLIKVRVRYAKINGLKKLITYAKRSNPGSCNGLIKCGFKLYEPQIEWADKDCIYFMYELA